MNAGGGPRVRFRKCEIEGRLPLFDPGKGSFRRGFWKSYRIRHDRPRKTAYVTGKTLFDSEFLPPHFMLGRPSKWVHESVRKARWVEREKGIECVKDVCFRTRVHAARSVPRSCHYGVDPVQPTDVAWLFLDCFSLYTLFKGGRFLSTLQNSWKCLGLRFVCPSHSRLWGPEIFVCYGRSRSVQPLEFTNMERQKYFVAGRSMG